MTNALAVTQTDRYFVATDQTALETAHTKLREWTTRAAAAILAELTVEREQIEIARANKWAVKPFAARIARLVRRQQFFEKATAALDAGFVLVPNFDLNVFAIRTAAKTPRGKVQSGQWNRFIQASQILPQGEGRYVDPNPFIETHTEQERRGDKVDAVFYQSPTVLDDELEFPLAIASPAMMTAAGNALGMKLFDEVGVAVDRRRNNDRERGDPILVGVIRNPNPNKPDLSFFLGWYFDPSQL